MLPLRDLQRYFKDSIFNKNEQLNIFINENNLTAEKRLQIYRNNIFITLTTALRNIYPSIQRLVGEEFFAGLANKYIRVHPSTSGNLHAFGDKFAEFISVFPPAQTLSYLPDVARLEWAYHEVFHGEDYISFDINKLKSIPKEKYGNIKFKLNPNCRLFAFRFPIVHIWQICKIETNNQAEVNLAEGGEKVLVIRRQLEVTFEKLTEGEFVLLSALKRGIIFAEACALALHAELRLDVNIFLQKHILSGTIIGMELI